MGSSTMAGGCCRRDRVLAEVPAWFYHSHRRGALFTIWLLVSARPAPLLGGTDAENAAALSHDRPPILAHPSNELFAIELFVSTVTGAFAWVAMIAGIFGMK